MLESINNYKQKITGRFKPVDEPQQNPNWEYLKLWNQAEQIGIELMTLNAYIINQNSAKQRRR